MNNTSISSLNLDAIADGILDGSFDLSKFDADAIASLQNIAETYKEEKRIDAEYLEGGDASVREHKAKRQAASEVAKTQVIKEAHVGDTSFIDSCNTPTKDDDDNEIIVEANSKIDDDDESDRIARGHKADPEDGMHVITLTSYPNKLSGRNGNSDFRIFNLRDVKEYNEWTVFVSEEQLKNRLEEISYNNKGMLAGMTKKAAFESLMVNPITCWTVKNTKGKIVTYFDENAFNKYFRWVQAQKAEAEERYAKSHSKVVSKLEEAKSYEF